MNARDASGSPARPAHGILRRPIDGLLFIIVVPILAHLCFSWIGFNPSDDGFILAGSRRIADGQIPHLDFISIRTAGSYLLHAPEVMFGGDRTYWISRYVAWLEFGITAWCWVLILDRTLMLRLSEWARLVAGATIFMLGCHNVPISVWHTHDGMLAVSLGLLLCLGSSDWRRTAGFFIIGSAFLFKQGYAFMVPGALLLLDGWRRPRFWIAAAAPGAIGGLALLVLGALPDAVRQLGSRTELFSYGVMTYLYQWGLPAGLLLGLLAMALAFPRAGGSTGSGKAGGRGVPAGVLLLHAPAVAAIIALWFGMLRDAPVFGLFGAALGATLWLLVPGGGSRPLARAGALVVLTAWCISISTSGIYNSPLMATGILAVLLMGYARIAIEQTGGGAFGRVPMALGVAVLAVCLFAFVTARLNYIYRERPASELTSPLGDVFPGGEGIWTNPNTHAFLEDLNEAIRKAAPQEYAIIPALAGWWAKSPQPNPLSIDWAIGNELRTPELARRVQMDIESRRGRLVIIVQKVQASALATDIAPRAGKKERNELVLYVRSNYELIDSTDFFDLYR